MLFAILIIAFSSYQAFVVPNQNAEVEFNHNQDVQTDMQDLRNSLLDVRSVRFDENDDPKVVSEHRPVRVRLGTQFPERLIALNPPRPSGTLETEDGTFEIRGAEVASTEFDQYENDLIRVHDTRLIAYEPSYTEYQEPPITRIEHSLGYNDFDGANITTSDQRLIRGLDDDIIDVILLDGDVSRSSSGSVTLDPETVDGPTERVPIRSDNGPIELEFTTNQPEVWEEALSDVSSVNSVTPEGDSVIVVLENGEYDLRMTTVRLEGEGGDETFTNIQKEPSDGGATDPRIYDTNWDTAQMENENIEFDGETLLIDSGEIGDEGDQVQIDGFVDVFEADSPSDPIFEASVDIGSTNRTVVDPPNENQLTDESGTATANIDVGIGNARLFASAGDDADRLPIEVRGNIEGVVEDENGDAIEGATVEISSIGVSDTTDEQGQYALRSLSPDTYDVTADAGGFDPSTETVELSASADEDNDGIVRQNFQLEPETGGGAILVDGEAGGFDADESEQEFEFELGRNLAEGETVIINLDDPQGPGAQRIDYEGSTVETDGPGSLVFSVSGNNQDAEIVYTASGTEEAGDSIEVTISGFDPGNQAAGNSYDVVFEGSDGSTITRSFQVGA